MARRLMAALILVSLLGQGLAPAPAQAQLGDQLCFPETQQCVSGRVREFWEQNGGLAVFGFPITAAAMEVNRDTGRAYLTQWFELSGVKIIMGKGGMSEADYRKYFVPNKAIYLTTVGYGTGALLGRGIKRVRDALWLKELGIAQAIWVLEVENFGPFLVESDLQGNSLFERENRKTNAQVAEAFRGLKEPALKRYGETTSREDEVV